MLFRRFTNWGMDVTRDYVKALEAREIPHLLVGSKSFHAREEVQTLRAAMAAIEWPDDELSVYATLRGRCSRFPTALSCLQVAAPVSRACAGPTRDAEALHLLAELASRTATGGRIVATVNALLEHTRAHAGFVLRPGGHQVLANVNRICDLARASKRRAESRFAGSWKNWNRRRSSRKSARRRCWRKARRASG